MKINVIHAGYPGDNTRAMLKRIRKDVLAHAPTAVTVLCGTNDAVNPRALVPPEEYASNLAAILTMIHEIGASALLISPLPVHSPEVIVKYGFDYPNDFDLNPTILNYVETARRIAGQMELPFLDLFHIFHEIGMVGADVRSLIRNQANSGGMDGAHPTEEGYRLISAVLFQTLQDHRFDCSRLVCFGDSITYGYPYPGMGTLDGGNFPALLLRMFQTQNNPYPMDPVS